MVDLNTHLEWPYPKYLLVETIRNCNARCVFCPFGAGQIQQSGIMQEELYAKIEKDMLEHANDIVRVTMHLQGEPLLDRKLDDRIKRLKDGGIKETAIATNASLLDEDRAKSLLSAGIDIIKLSLTTINREKYTRLRVGLDYDIVMRNAEKLFAIRDSIRPKTLIHISMEQHPILDQEDRKAWIAHWDKWIGVNDVLKFYPIFDFITEDKNSLPKNANSAPCEALFQTMTIAYTGQVPLCCNDLSAGKSIYITGDVSRESIKEVWQGKKMRTARELHRSGNRAKLAVCNSCFIWDEELKTSIIKGGDA